MMKENKPIFSDEFLDQLAKEINGETNSLAEPEDHGKHPEKLSNETSC